MPGCPHPPEKLELLFETRDYITGDPFLIRRCPECGLALTQPVPAALGRYYPAGYHGGTGQRRFPALVEAWQRALYGRRARTVERWTGGPGRVLDIGCGPGWLLRAFQARGWQVHGTERSDDAARHAREVLRLDVQTGPLSPLPWPDGHFDAVVLWHVLEHLPDPAPALAEASRVLRPGGVLLVGVPNFGSIEARLGRGRWFHLDAPRHLAHFTPAILRGCLDQAGLTVRGSSFLAPEYDAFSFVQTALNRLGLRRNLLYNLLRGRGAKLWEEGGTPWVSVVLTLLLAGPLSLLAVPWTFLAGLARQGATVTCWSVKR